MSILSTNKTILVTGGAGYIGSHTVLALLESGFEVVIIDKAPLHQVFKNSLLNFGENVKFEQINLLDLPVLKAVFEKYKFDGVIHFAADPAIVSPLPKHASQYYTQNVVSSINLIDTCREFKVNNFVFSSTAAMYGVPEILPIKENSKPQPINIYGYTKSMIERMLKDYNSVFGFNSIALRYFNACGADKQMRTGECHFPEIHLIPNILQSLGTDKVFELYGNDYNTPDGTNVRDYIHVTDLALGHVKALDYLFANEEENRAAILNEKEEGSGFPNQTMPRQAKDSISAGVEIKSNQGLLICEAINLGTGAGYSNKQIFETAQKVIGQEIPLKIVGRRGNGDPDELVADNAKAREILGWEPTNSSLENILQTSWDWEKVKKNIVL
jgi:UDP-glucose 4-epimerase